MSLHNEEFTIPTLAAIKKLFEPLYSRLDKIELVSNLNDTKQSQKFYRNEDLKRIFSFSSNTIVKYRETGILPFTKLGDIYFYDVKKINKILLDNEVSL